MNTALKKKEMVLALTETLGVIAYACKKTGITRPTHYNWMESDAEYKLKCDEIIDAQVDFVEGKLLENIKNNSDTAIIFYLKTKGRHRGYIEKFSSEHSVTIEPSCELDFSKLSKESLKEIYALAKSTETESNS